MRSFPITAAEYEAHQKRVNGRGSSSRRMPTDQGDAGARPAPAPKGQLRRRNGPNKTEAAFGEWLALKYGHIGLEFEAISLRMPGGTIYTPDWSLRGEGALRFWEVKGFMREAARVRLKEFAAHFSKPHSCFAFRFYLVCATDRRLLTWNIQEVAGSAQPFSGLLSMPITRP